MNKGENILWQGEAMMNEEKKAFERDENEKLIINYSVIFSKIVILISDLYTLIVFLFVLFTAFLNGYYFVIGALALIFIARLAYLYFKKEEPTTEYAITNYRILFRLARLPKTDILEIHISQLKGCVVEKFKNGLGTIFLVPKNPENLHKEFYTEDHTPLLYGIKNPDEIAQLIRQCIDPDD